MVAEMLKPVRGKEAIVYIAAPSRRTMQDRFHEFAEHTRQAGFAPIQTFAAGPYEDFEGGPVGREDTIQFFTFGLQRLAPGGTRVYGASEGVYKEVWDRLDWDPEKRIRVFPQFDPLWGENHEKWSKVLGDPFRELRGSHTLAVLVANRAGGKTHWIEELMKHFANKLARVKTFTTRGPRDENDKKYYHHVTKEQFEAAKKSCRFLESVHKYGDYYGSSLDEIKRVLKTKNAICAMTPSGAQALYECRLEINVVFINLIPASEAVLLKNMRQRGIVDSAKQKVILDDAKNFILADTHKHIPHTRIVLDRSEADRQKVFDAIVPLLK